MDFLEITSMHVCYTSAYVSDAQLRHENYGMLLSQITTITKHPPYDVINLPCRPHNYPAKPSNLHSLQPHLAGQM